MSRGALRALYVSRRPADAYVRCECPRCQDTLLVYVCNGKIEEIQLGCGCVAEYSQEEWADLREAARDLADDSDREPDGDDVDE